VPSTRNQDREPGVRRKGYTVLLALAVFACLGGMPAILHALHLKISTAPPTSSDGIRLLGAPQALRPVPLPPVARPVDPGGPTATFPLVSESEEAAAVAAEDNRLRAMLHDSFRISQPRIVHYSHALPTLVLPAGTRYSFDGGVRVLVSGRSAYTVTDLIRYGALRLLPDGAALLVDNVFVSSGARLALSSSQVSAIYLDSTPRRSASIVAWGGNLDFRGTAPKPLTVEGWDEAAMTPAHDTGNGRPYIREVAGRMTLTEVRVSSLGFWSGRTGGVAWTGLSTHASFGSAVASTFTGNTYGAFVTRGHDVRFLADLFEANQLDGLHIHRGSVRASASYSAAVRNGLNGFHVDRATLRTVLLDDASEHNATNGFLVDGRPLVSTASASGNGVAPGQGSRIEYSSASGNGRTGILIEGGNRTVLKGDEVCARLTGIALRYNASNAILDANDVRCGPRTGIRIGPQAPGALVFGNAVSSARIAMLVISPGGSVEIDKSLITLASVFGISVRGVNSIVSGKDNVISGIGFRAVDSRAEATAPALSGSNTANWAYARKGTVLTYLEFHPLAVFWLSVAFLVLTGCLWTRRRRASTHPYPESTHWEAFDEEPEPVPVPIGASVGAQAGPAPAVAAPVGTAPVGTSAGSGLAGRGLPGSELAESELAGAQAGSALAGAQVGVGDLAPAGYMDRLDQLNQLDRLDHLGQPDHLDKLGEQLHHRGTAGQRLGRGTAGERLDPPWSPGDDARTDSAGPYRPPYESGGVPGYRGPFDPALPDAAWLDGQRLDDGPQDGGPLGGRRREDARRREDTWSEPGPLDAPRRDVPRGTGGPLNRGLLDDGRLNGGRPDGGRLDQTRRDNGRRDNVRREDARQDNDRRDSGRGDNGRRDAAPRNGRRLGDGRLDPLGPGAERVDPMRIEDARSYDGQSEGHRQPSRHGRSEPVDSTKPLPQVGDHQ
jgi:hypothetical protein